MDNKKMNIGIVWLKINDFPNIPFFHHSIIPTHLKRRG